MAKHTRHNIYSAPSLAAALACLGSLYEKNSSGRVNAVCERYLAMVPRLAPMIDDTVHLVHEALEAGRPGPKAVDFRHDSPQKSPQSAAEGDNQNFAISEKALN